MRLSNYAVVLAVLLGCLFQTPAAAVNYDGSVPLPTRWISTDGSVKQLHEAPIYSGPLVLAPTLQISPPGPTSPAPNGRIAIVVSNSVYRNATRDITEFTWDLAAAGYSTHVQVYVSGTAASVRSSLASLYAQPEGLKGAILIGNIPYAIFEMMETWGDTPEYTDFPCDIFYMDLNGTWSDTLTDGLVQPNNGKYDTRSGNLALEIWVGRIKTGNLTSLGSESSLVSSYLAKNRNYRSQVHTTDLRAVAYIDDDWSGGTAEDVNCLRMVFGTSAVTGYSDPEVTTAADFMNNRLPESTRWYMLRSHGWPGGHGFYRQNKAYFESVTSADYGSMDPPGAFFSLFVCSGCDYTEVDNLGSAIAFNPESDGLLAFGSAKTGGMWADTFFYSPMAQGACVGESFRQWFNDVQYFDGAPQWFYGMVLIGDPSLHPNPADPPTYYDLTLLQNPSNGGTITPSPGSHVYPGGLPIPLIASPAVGFHFVRWDGAVADPYSTSTSITLDQNQTVTAVFASNSAAYSKLLANDAYISLIGKVVTYAGTGFFYIEEDDRTSGIRVDKPSHNLASGMRANVTGIMKTNSDDERYILASISAQSGSGSVTPFGMSGKSVCGADWSYDAGLHIGQRGILWGGGPSNIGLLVKTWGKVESVDAVARSFVISDSSQVTMPGSHEMTKVTIKVPAPSGVALPDINQFVIITGISSCYKDSSTGDLLPQIWMIGPAGM